MCHRPALVPPLLADHFQGICRAFPRAGAAGNAFKRWRAILNFNKISRGTCVNTRITAVTQFFIEYHHTKFIYCQGAGRAVRDTGLALVAHGDFKIPVSGRDNPYGRL